MSAVRGSRPSLLAFARHVAGHRANRGRRVAALARAFGWQVAKRTLRRSWDVALPGGCTLRCPPGSPVASSALYAGGRPDFDEIALLEELLRPGDGFVDVGANVGLYTLIAAGLCRGEGEFDAFEPGDLARARLEENLARNGLAGRVRVHAAAAGERTGRAAFLREHDAQNRLQADVDAAESAHEVDVVTLDEVVGERRPRVGKLDVEGAELLALGGAEALLARGEPSLWILEVNDALGDFGASPAALGAHFTTRGFSLARYDADARSLELDDEAWRGGGNVLAVHVERLGFVSERIPGLRIVGAPGGALATR